MTAAPFDKARMQLTADTPQEEAELLALFLRGAEKQIARMQEALTTLDWADWKSAAHYLRGSAANLGMQELMEQCKQAEIDLQLPEKALFLLNNINAQLQRIRDYTANL